MRLTLSQTGAPLDIPGAPRATLRVVVFDFSLGLVSGFCELNISESVLAGVHRTESYVLVRPMVRFGRPKRGTGLMRCSGSGKASRFERQVRSSWKDRDALHQDVFWRGGRSSQASVSVGVCLA